jgi:type I restriction enzyme S subunit
MMLSNLNLLATAPGGVVRLRELILTLAVQGKLLPQDPRDEPASELLKKIRVEKDRLIAEGKIKRDKPLAKIDDDEKPFLLPAGWEWERFGAIAGIERGGSPRPIQSFLTNDPDGLNWIKIGDTEKGGKYITSSGEKIRRDGLSKTRMVFPGDFLLTNSMSFGRPYITQIEGCIHDGWLRISPPSSLNKDFLYVLLSSRFIRTVFEAAAAGGVVLNLNADKVRTVPIPLPPIAEQSRIVTRVEELMRLCDALEAKGQLEAAQHAQLVSTLLGTLTQSETSEQLSENWQRIATHFDLLLDRPQAVDALEQTILQLAVRGLLVPQDPTDEPASALLQKIRTEKDRLIAEGKIKRDKPLLLIADDKQPFELPNGWEWTRFPDLCAITGGATPSKAVALNWIGEIPWVSPKDMKIPFISDAQDHVSDSVVRGSLSLIPSGSLLMVVRGMILAHSFPIAQTRASVTINQDMKALTPFEPEVLAFLALICEGMKPEILGLIDRSSHGTCKLESVKIFGMPIPLPPLVEQSRIVTRVESLRRLCGELRQRLAASQTTQAHLAEALLQDVA